MYSLFHLVLVDLLLQDFISVRVNLHLLLFLQLPSQPGQILLKRAGGEGVVRGAAYCDAPNRCSGILIKLCVKRYPRSSHTTYLRSFQVAALPLPGRTVLRHGDLDLLKLGLCVLQLHLQVLCQLGSLHRLQRGRNRTHSIKKPNDEIPELWWWYSKLG